MLDGNVLSGSPEINRNPMKIEDERDSMHKKQKPKNKLNYDPEDVSQNYDDSSAGKEPTMKISKKRIRLASSSSSRVLRKSIVAELGLSVEKLP